MKIKIAALAAACAISMVMLAGCSQNAGSSEPTAQSVLESVQKNISSAKSMESTVELNMTAGGDELSSVGGSMSVSLNADVQTTTDPAANHLDGTMSILGTDADIDMYTVIEGSQICNYMNVMDQWMVQKFDYDKDELETIDASAEDLLEHVSSLTLADETTDVDGTDAYVISGTLKGEDIENLMNSMTNTMGSLLGSSEDIDISDMSVDVEYAVNSSDEKPLYIQLSFSGLDSLTQDSGISITELSEKITYRGFDTVDSITVPQEAIDNAADLGSYGADETSSSQTETTD